MNSEILPSSQTEDLADNDIMILDRQGLLAEETSRIDDPQLRALRTFLQSVASETSIAGVTIYSYRDRRDSFLHQVIATDYKDIKGMARAGDLMDVIDEELEASEFRSCANGYLFLGGKTVEEFAQLYKKRFHEPLTLSQEVIEKEGPLAKIIHVEGSSEEMDLYMVVMFKD